jgi:hypothetical protein
MNIHTTANVTTKEEGAKGVRVLRTMCAERLSDQIHGPGSDFELIDIITWLQPPRPNVKHITFWTESQHTAMTATSVVLLVLTSFLLCMCSCTNIHIKRLSRLEDWFCVPTTPLTSSKIVVILSCKFLHFLLSVTNALYILSEAHLTILLVCRALRIK